MEPSGWAFFCLRVCVSSPGNEEHIDSSTAIHLQSVFQTVVASWLALAVVTSRSISLFPASPSLDLLPLQFHTSIPLLHILQGSHH
jgi:hypothetical protein